MLIAAETATKSGGGASSLLFFGAIFAGMYFLLLRPQRKRMKEAQALRTSLAVGDEVVLASGIYGYISEIKDEYLWLEVADGHDKEKIEIRVDPKAVARRIAPADKN